MNKCHEEKDIVGSVVVEALETFQSNPTCGKKRGLLENRGWWGARYTLGWQTRKSENSLYTHMRNLAQSPALQLPPLGCGMYIYIRQTNLYIAVSRGMFEECRL